MLNNFEEFNKQKKFGPEQSEGIIDILKKELEQEFEEVYGNIEPREAREQFRKRWLAEEIVKATEMEDQNASLEEQIEKYKKAKMDSVTGFERREGLFREMDEKIKKILGVTGKEAPEVVLDRIENETRDFQNVGEAVVMSDVSYLSLANKEGHAIGDELLAKISSAIRKNKLRAYRHGGDEITALISGSESEIDSTTNALEKEVEQIKDISSLQKYDLQPNIDIGTAKFSEAFEAFKNFLGEIPRDQDGKVMSNISTLKELENIWLAIADKRSFINKGLTRISLLLSRIDKENYDDIISSLRKGGYDIKDSELREINAKAGKKDKEKLIWAYINKKEEEAISQLDSDDRIRAEIVYNIAKRKFDNKI